jgi:hypothetical protein
MSKISILKQLIEVLKAMIATLKKLILKKQEAAHTTTTVEPIDETFNDFAFALRFRESGNNYQIVNAWGYLGAYQFGMACLADLGYAHRIPGTTGWANNAFEFNAPLTKEQFLRSPEIQDEAFRKHVKKLISSIEARYSSYIGKTVNGVLITLSGMVAGAHLGGLGGLGRFLQGTDTSDALGTPISAYVGKFGGYNIKVGLYN